MPSKNNIFVLFISFFALVQPCFGEDRTDREDTITRREDTIIRREDTITYRDSMVLYRDTTILYRNELIKYLEDNTYYRFGEAINGVYVISLQKQEYIDSKITLGDWPELDTSLILKNVAVGSVVIVAAVLMPYLAPGLPSVLAFIVTSIDATAVANAALTGAAISASISGIKTYVSTGGDPEKTFYRSLEGASEGYKWGAVLGYASELSKAALSVKTYKGGYFGELPKRAGIERHHLIPDSAIQNSKRYTALDRGSGPAIEMSTIDHRILQSTGNSSASQTIQNRQLELLNAGKVWDAFELGVDEIRQAGLYYKYQKAINEARNSLEIVLRK